VLLFQDLKIGLKAESFVIYMAEILLERLYPVRIAFSILMEGIEFSSELIVPTLGSPELQSRDTKLLLQVNDFRVAALHIGLESPDLSLQIANAINVGALLPVGL
jgi:hypothetical protein